MRSINHLIICRRATPPHPCHHSPMRLLAPFFHICPFERRGDIYKLIIVACSFKLSFRSFLPFILKLIQILWRRPSPGNAWQILNGPRGSDHIYIFCSRMVMMVMSNHIQGVFFTVPPNFQYQNAKGWAANQRFCSMKFSMYKRSLLVEQHF